MLARQPGSPSRAGLGRRQPAVDVDEDDDQERDRAGHPHDARRRAADRRSPRCRPAARPGARRTPYSGCGASASTTASAQLTIIPPVAYSDALRRRQARAQRRRGDHLLPEHDRRAEEQRVLERVQRAASAASHRTAPARASRAAPRRTATKLGSGAAERRLRQRAADAVRSPVAERRAPASGAHPAAGSATGGSTGAPARSAARRPRSSSTCWIMCTQKSCALQQLDRRGQRDARARPGAE